MRGFMKLAFFVFSCIIDIRKDEERAAMNQKHTLDELNNLSREELITTVLSMQGQLDTLNGNIDKLIEQIRIANQQRFGRSTETMKSIEGQLSFFNEAEALFDSTAQEPTVEEVLPAKPRKKKQKGQRNIDLSGFPQEIVPPHAVSEDTLDSFYGKGNWKRMPDECEMVKHFGNIHTEKNH